MSIEEQALVYCCGETRRVGIVSLPRQPSKRGVLVVVGGPQYRAGSHRQFTLLCRALAEKGVAAMRFDYSGMGDSEGEVRGFEDILPDIRAAIDEFCARVPELVEVAIWGLCDGASAALFYAPGDARVSGLVLLNPWVRTSSGIAKTRLKHYYRSRFTDREFWRKVGSGEFEIAVAARSFAAALGAAFGAGTGRAGAGHGSPTGPAPTAAALPDRMADGLSLFKGRLLLILSGKDLTAQEFEELEQNSPRWGRLLSASRVERRVLPVADHTFSRREWSDKVAAWTADWVRSW